MTLRLQKCWPLLALFAAAAMLAAAHAFETFGGLAPCALCLKQREIYWGAASVAAAALVFMRVRPQPHLARLADVILGLVFVVSAVVAAYHVAVEQHWVLARCEGTNLDDIAPLGMSGPVSAPSCDVAAWRMFGVSMAGYNALISLALAALSFIAAAESPDA